MGNSAFVDFVLEVMSPWRVVAARRMFGGHGIYHAGVMFALLSDGQLFLKVDDESRPAFDAAGLPPFVYEAKGRRVSLSYHRAPEAMLDDPDVAREWAERAWQAALRAHLIKKARQEALPVRQPNARQGRAP
jgi:DNA transformation protein